MAKSIGGIQKKRGRPKTGKVPIRAIRMDDDLVAVIDDWADRQPEPKPSRSEAIRRLIEKALLK
jgi:hypothetical protein